MTLQDVSNKIDYEGGFDYFVGGSDFKQVKDEQFHQLRANFVIAYEALHNYLPEPSEDEF